MSREPVLLEPESHPSPPGLWDTGHLRSVLSTSVAPFRFHLRTMEEAAASAKALSTFYPLGENAEMGIWELLANAVEHGNLGITYSEKSLLVSNGTLHKEIERRLRLPVFRDRKVEVRFHILDDRIVLRVEDEGDGFKFRDYEKGIASVRKPHGRGIAIARDLAFDKLDYKGSGSEVEAVCFRQAVDDRDPGGSAS